MYALKEYSSTITVNEMLHGPIGLIRVGSRHPKQRIPRGAVDVVNKPIPRFMQERMPPPLPSESIEVQAPKAFAVDIEQRKMLAPIGIMVESEQVTRMFNTDTTNSPHTDVPPLEMKAILTCQLGGPVAIPLEIVPTRTLFGLGSRASL